MGINSMGFFLYSITARMILLIYVSGLTGSEIIVIYDGS